MMYPQPRMSGYSFGAIAAQPPGAVLWKNMTPGEHVRQWQHFLLYRGISVGGTGPDGKFGPATESGTKAFQAQVGLPQTGVVDTLTVQRAASLGYGTARVPSPPLPNLSAPRVVDVDPSLQPRHMKTEVKAAIGLGLLGAGLIGWGMLGR
jgi:peptidoglycan hydrolase-like protein with peptidoglycan-binding domain